MSALPVPAGTAIFPASNAAMQVPPGQSKVAPQQDLHRQRGYPDTGTPEQELLHPLSGLFRLMAERPAFFIIRKKYRIRRSRNRPAAGDISKTLFGYLCIVG